MTNRQSEWNKIWNKKYTVYKDAENLHISAGYDDLNYAEWKSLTRYFIDKIKIKPNDDVLEVGCGSGAFLNEIPEAKSLSGIDYAEDAINKIKSTIEGKFYVSEATKLPFADNSFDVVISFGVFFYFNDLEYAQLAIDEMQRVLKPGGKIFIGEVNNLEKKELAEKLRAESEEKRDQHRVSKSNVDHLYFPISFFEEVAANSKMDIAIIKQDVPELSFYGNAPYRFSVIFTNKG